ncbi:hypothetical protein OPQ81_011766 [Rhizoctonia solani]|nr:hypothetical protein OPQ81_011766 [Rhizoctonia solani]
MTRPGFTALPPSTALGTPSTSTTLPGTATDAFIHSSVVNGLAGVGFVSPRPPPHVLSPSSAARTKNPAI